MIVRPAGAAIKEAIRTASGGAGSTRAEEATAALTKKAARTNTPGVKSGAVHTRAHFDFLEWNIIVGPYCYLEVRRRSAATTDYLLMRRVLPPPLIDRLIRRATSSAWANTRKKFSPRILRMSCSL